MIEQKLETEFVKIEMIPGQSGFLLKFVSGNSQFQIIARSLQWHRFDDISYAAGFTAGEANARSEMTADVVVDAAHRAGFTAGEAHRQALTDEEKEAIHRAGFADGKRFERERATLLVGDSNSVTLTGNEAVQALVGLHLFITRMDEGRREATTPDSVAYFRQRGDAARSAYEKILNMRWF